MNVFPDAWQAFTATRDRLATARRMASWSGQRSWRRRPWQNRTGSLTTPARAVASSACANALGIRHHRLDERERQQCLAVLARKLHALLRRPEAAVGEPGGGFESVSQLGALDFAAEDAHDERHQIVAVARLLADGADDALGAAAGVARCPFRESPSDRDPRCFPAVLRQHGAAVHAGTVHECVTQTKHAGRRRDNLQLHRRGIRMTITDRGPYVRGPGLDLLTGAIVTG